MNDHNNNFDIISDMMDRDIRTIDNATDEATIRHAIETFDKLGQNLPIPVYAAARLQLCCFIKQQPSDPLAIEAALCIARHTHDNKRKAQILKTVAATGNPEVAAVLGDLAMREGHVGEAAYWLRVARRSILGE